MFKNDEKKKSEMEEIKNAAREQMTAGKQKDLMKFVILSEIKEDFLRLYKDKDFTARDDPDVADKIFNLLKQLSAFNTVSHFCQCAVQCKVPAHSGHDIFSDVLKEDHMSFYIDNLRGEYEYQGEEIEYKKSAEIHFAREEN